MWFLCLLVCSGGFLCLGFFLCSHYGYSGPSFLFVDCLPLRVRPVEEPSHAVILLHYCSRQSEALSVSPGRPLRPIPSTAPRCSYASFSSPPIRLQGWSSLGGSRVSSQSFLRMSSCSLWPFSTLSMCLLGLSPSTVCRRMRVCTGAQGWSSPERFSAPTTTRTRFL